MSHSSSVAASFEISPRTYEILAFRPPTMRHAQAATRILLSFHFRFVIPALSPVRPALHDHTHKVTFRCSGTNTHRSNCNF